jgi:enoyl-CoA hydratase/carnithine racemase
MTNTSEVGHVDLSMSDGIATLALCNPAKLNAISLQMWEQLNAFALEFSEDAAVRCVIVQGAGSKAFSVGADISEFASQRSNSLAVRHYEEVTKRAMAAFAKSPKVIVAAIDGYCIGGGLALALSCDIRVASDRSQFAIPAARLGLGYGYSSVRQLVSTVGGANAKLILFSADRFGSLEAMQFGLVQKVTRNDVFETEVRRISKRIADNAPLTLKAAKVAIDTTQAEHGEIDLTVCAELDAACFSSEDYREGQIAFAEKRAPHFVGR